MGGGWGEATAGEPVLATLLWGMLYADNAGIVSQPPEKLCTMMRVIVVVCVAFGLTISEAKTETLGSRWKEMPKFTAKFSVEVAGQMQTKQTSRYLGGNVNHNADLPIQVNRRIRNAWCTSRKYIF